MISSAVSFLEAEFVAAHSAGKIVRYLRFVLSDLGYPQVGPTPIYIDNESALRIINDNISPTERTRHMDLRFFAIQDWREGDGTEGSGDLAMVRTPGRPNPSDDLTKSLGWVLHGKHCRRIMGHYNYPD